MGILTFYKAHPGQGAFFVVEKLQLPYGNCVLEWSKNIVKSSFFLMCEREGYGMIALVISVKARRLSDVLCKKPT